MRIKRFGEGKNQLLSQRKHQGKKKISLVTQCVSQLPEKCFLGSRLCPSCPGLLLQAEVGRVVSVCCGYYCLRFSKEGSKEQVYGRKEERNSGKGKAKQPC